ncbi:MAG: hypothetical protein LBU73_01030 [Helicobacteraceae bacterium]|jgi:uncharacterized protein|nr:hypothetical protein [Helicobacteraceae bacterium]
MGVLLRVLLPILALIYLFYKLFSRKSKKKADKSNAEELVKCDNCGVYFSPQNGVKENGKIYCSEECAK